MQDWRRVAPDDMCRILGHHLVDAGDPVAERAPRRPAQRIEVRPGLVEVVPRKDHPLPGQPDVELVRGLARRGNQLEADPGDLEAFALAREAVRRLDLHRRPSAPRRRPPAHSVEHHVAGRPPFRRNRDADAHLLLGEQVEALGVGRPDAAPEPLLPHEGRFGTEVVPGPHLDALVRLVERRRAVGVVPVAVGVDDGPHRQGRDLLEGRTDLRGGGRQLAGVDDDDAVVADDHRVCRDLVAERRVDVLGDPCDGRLEHPVAFQQAPGCLAGLGGDLDGRRQNHCERRNGGCSSHEMTSQQERRGFRPFGCLDERGSRGAI